MTDSSTNDKATDGGLEMGPSADELFGGAETESLEGEPVDRRPRDGTAAVTVEDRTAADVFDELQTEASAGVDVSDLLADESPEDIIASADEPAEPAADVDDDLTVDDETLGDLLLTDRTEGEEFLWVDAGDADESAFSTAATDDPDPADSFDGTSESTTDTAADVSSGDAEAAVSSDDATADEDDPSDASPAEASVESWASPEADPIEVDDPGGDDHDGDGGDDRAGDEPNANPDSEAAAAPDESATDESSTASGSTDGPVPLVDPDSASETDEEATRDGSTPSDDETSFRGGLVTDSPGSSVYAGGDEEPDEDDAVETADSSDDTAGDGVSPPTREGDRSDEAEDDGSSGPFALLAKLPVVGRLF